MRQVPSTLKRGLQPSDLGIDVSPIAPGERYTPAAVWEENNPERGLATLAPLTEHRAFTTGLRRFRVQHDGKEWEVDARRADKVSDAGTVSEVRDVVLYLPDRAKSQILTVGRLYYQGSRSGPGSVHAEEYPADSAPPEVTREAVARVLEQASQGMARAGTYDNEIVGRIIRDTARKLGGTTLATNRYFVPNAASGNGLTYAERFVAFATAIERTFGFTVLTVPLPPSFDSARAMSVALVSQYELEARRFSDEISGYVDAFREGSRKRVEHEWELRVQQELKDLKSDMERTFRQIRQIEETVDREVDDLTRVAWQEMLGWLATEEQDLTAQVDRASREIQKQSLSRQPLSPKAMAAAKAAAAVTQDPEVRRQLDDPSVREQLNKLGLGGILDLLES